MQKDELKNNILKANINLSLKDLDDVKCDSCGNLYFDSQIRFKRISPLYTQNNKPSFVPVEVFICKSCNKISEELNPHIKDLDEK